MIRNQPVILFSGGLDSFCMYTKTKKEAERNNTPLPLLVYFHLGLPENDKELEFMKELELYKDIIVNYNFKLADWKLMNEVLPFRNVHLVLGGFHYGSKIYLGATASSTNNDKSQEFATKLLDVAKMISINPEKNPEGLLQEDMEILLPFRNKSKTQFIKEYLDDGGSVSELIKTRSCYSGETSNSQECGKCASCMRKYVAFVNNDLPVNMKHDITLKELQTERLRAHDLLHKQVAQDTQDCIQKYITNFNKNL